eukprot:COSAG04_NODE_1506_length_6504_cov_4.962998_2_plen_192_part_00
MPICRRLARSCSFSPPTKSAVACATRWCRWISRASTLALSPCSSRQSIVKRRFKRVATHSLLTENPCCAQVPLSRLPEARARAGLGDVRRAHGDRAVGAGHAGLLPIRGPELWRSHDVRPALRAGLRELLGKLPVLYRRESRRSFLPRCPPSPSAAPHKTSPRAHQGPELEAFYAKCQAVGGHGGGRGGRN